MVLLVALVVLGERVAYRLLMMMMLMLQLVMMVVVVVGMILKTRTLSEFA